MDWLHREEPLILVAPLVDMSPVADRAGDGPDAPGAEAIATRKDRGVGTLYLDLLHPDTCAALVTQLE